MYFLFEGDLDLLNVFIAYTIFFIRPALLFFVVDPVWGDGYYLYGDKAYIFFLVSYIYFVDFDKNSFLFSIIM